MLVGNKPGGTALFQYSISQGTNVVTMVFVLQTHLRENRSLLIVASAAVYREISNLLQFCFYGRSFQGHDTIQSNEELLHLFECGCENINAKSFAVLDPPVNSS